MLEYSSLGFLDSSSLQLAPFLTLHLKMYNPIADAMVNLKLKAADGLFSCLVSFHCSALCQKSVSSAQYIV